MSIPLWAQPIEALGPRIRAKALSPVELTQACLDRIAQVENGLRPPVLLEGDKTWSITERMRFYHVEGVSIAVIRDEMVQANRWPVSPGCR